MFKRVKTKEEFLALGSKEIIRRAEIAFKIYFLSGFFCGLGFYLLFCGLKK